MKILILCGIWAGLNVLISRLNHVGKRRQKQQEQADLIRFRGLSISEKEREWRVK